MGVFPAASLSGFGGFGLNLMVFSLDLWNMNVEFVFPIVVDPLRL
jgi:hypothetical protein